jgi:hypothetical protein
MSNATELLRPGSAGWAGIACPWTDRLSIRLKELRVDRTSLSLNDLTVTCVPLPWLVTGVESEKIRDGFSKPPCHSFNLFE